MSRHASIKWLLLAILLAGCARPAADATVTREILVRFEEDGAAAYLVTPTKRGQSFHFSESITWTTSDGSGPCLSYHVDKVWKNAVAATGGLVLGTRPGERWSAQPVSAISRVTEGTVFTPDDFDSFVFHVAVDQRSPDQPAEFKLNSAASFTTTPLWAAPPRCIRDVSELEGGNHLQSPIGTDVAGSAFDWTTGPGSAFIAFKSLEHEVLLATESGQEWTHRDEQGRDVQALMVLETAGATLRTDQYRAGPDGYFVAMFTPLPEELRRALPPEYAPLS